MPIFNQYVVVSDSFILRKNNSVKIISPQQPLRVFEGGATLRRFRLPCAARLWSRQGGMSQIMHSFLVLGASLERLGCQHC